MPHNRVLVQWRRGVNGELGTFTFSPNPSIVREVPGKRTATLVVPLLDGAIVQNLGLDIRQIVLTGVLLNKANTWDTMETLRNNLINGISTGPGQLHIISQQRHIRYDGQITTDGIEFQAQDRTVVQDYTITIVVPNATEIDVPPEEITKVINSDAFVGSITTQTINSDSEVT